MLIAAAVLGLALAPGIYSFWSGGKLRSRLDDPLLPELVLAHSQRVSAVAGGAIGLGIVVLRSPLLLLLALLFLSVLAGGFPLRRRIFEESWSLWTYLSHSARFWLGALGSFLLIAAIPSTMAVVRPESSVAVGAALGAAALVISVGASSWLRLLLRARPLDAPEAEAAFRPILERAKCEPPLLFEAHAPGGRWVNAFALPSVKRGGVLFTRGLIEALSTRETAAIFAHEVAHLEHYTRRKVALGVVLVAVLAFLPLAIWGGPLRSILAGWEWVWPLALLLGLAARGTRHRAHESESDLRALELCRDEEALVSGLTKLHAILRVPRRFSADYEKMSSHPSVARRVQAIRRAAARKGGEGVEGGVSPFERVFLSADESRSAVLLDAERLHWLRGVPEDGKDVLARAEERRSLRYGEVAELGLEAGASQHVLVFRDSSGKKVRMPVSGADVAELQELLDRVDRFVGYEAHPAEAPTGRLWSLLLAIFGTIASFSWAVVVLAVLALVRPAASTLVALGCGSIASALFLLLRPGLFGAMLGPAPSLLLASGGIACLVLGWKRVRLPHSSKVDVRLAVLVPVVIAALSLLGAAGALASSLPMTLLHSWARTHGAFLAGVAAGAGGLATLRSARAFAGVLAFASVGALFLFVGSTPFRSRYVEDVFARPGAPIPVEDVGLEVVRRVTVRGGVFRLSLSPEATKLAVAVAPSGRAQPYVYASPVLVERAPGDLVSLSAIGFEFLDEERLLVLDESDRRASLEIRTLAGSGRVEVARELPLLTGMKLHFDGATGTWQVSGTEWEGTELVVVRGKLGSEEREETRFDLEDRIGSLVTVSASGWALGPRYDVPDFTRWEESPLPLASWVLVSSGLRFVTELGLSRPEGPWLGLGKSALQVTCSSVVLDPRFFCFAGDVERTAIWALDPEARSWESIGSLDGRLHADDGGGSGRIVLTDVDGGIVLVRVPDGSAMRPLLPEAGWGIFAWRNDVLAEAVSAGEGDETTVTLYTLAR